MVVQAVQAVQAVTTFRFEDRHPVRVKESGGMVWFVVKDICDALDIRNYRQAVESFDAEERGVCLVDTPGGPQEMLVVSEPGLYRLIMRSDKPEARHFQKWVFHDEAVLVSSWTWGWLPLSGRLTSPLVSQAAH
jgi:prophage antirepressor-like protein